MGTGIGKDCRRCGHQLTYDDGFIIEYLLCDECFNIVNFERPDLLVKVSDKEQEL